jgi:hypothetical protein
MNNWNVSSFRKNENLEIVGFLSRFGSQRLDKLRFVAFLAAKVAESDCHSDSEM